MTAPRADAMHPPTFTGQHALFLDFDGTLVELAERPELVRPDPQLADVLHACQQRLSGAVALLSGRRLESIDALLPGLHLPGAGLHGAQRRERPGGAIADLADSTGLAARLRERSAAWPGLWVEDKGAALAIHYREAPELSVRALELLHDTVQGSGLRIVSGKCVHEARPPAFDKGEALREFMQRAPFAGRVPLFAGDDVTDEDAVRVAQELGGTAIKVGLGSSRAAHRLVDPQALLLWLLAGSRSAATVAEEALP